jgi:hypothetical protein
MSSVILVWFPKTAVLIPAGRSSATHKAWKQQNWCHKALSAHVG